MDQYLILLSFLLFFLINKILIKKKILLNFNGEKHQKITGQTDIPLSGGILFIILLLYSFFDEGNFLISIVFLIFVVGFLSDLKIISSPKLRFFLQIFFLSVFIYYENLTIGSTRINFFDLFLENRFFNYFFVLFCLMVLINGSNFIDGLNGLLIGYFSIILVFLILLAPKLNLFLDNRDLLNLLYILVFILILNFLNKLFMGDSGSYSLSIFFGIVLIKTYYDNQAFSPFFIILLLWYPCFENLFSILRKFNLKKSPLKPDNNHLHQLFFYFLKKKYKIKNISANRLSSIVILSYNLILFIGGSINIYSTERQIFLIILSTCLYVLLYFKLFLFKYKIKLNHTN